MVEFETFGLVLSSTLDLHSPLTLTWSWLANACMLQVKTLNIILSVSTILDNQTGNQ